MPNGTEVDATGGSLVDKSGCLNIEDPQITNHNRSCFFSGKAYRLWLPWFSQKQLQNEAEKVEKLAAHKRTLLNNWGPVKGPVFFSWFTSYFRDVGGFFREKFDQMCGSPQTNALIWVKKETPHESLCIKSQPPPANQTAHNAMLISPSWREVNELKSGGTVRSYRYICSWFPFENKPFQHITSYFWDKCVCGLLNQFYVFPELSRNLYLFKTRTDSRHVISRLLLWKARLVMKYSFVVGHFIFLSLFPKK